jgi:hypothetical protein
MNYSPMDNKLINKVCDFVNHLVHLNEKPSYFSTKKSSTIKKTCPVTGLDISMQPKNSRFLSYTGVKWYYENDIDTFNLLLSRLSPLSKNKTLHEQFMSIAHSVRNEESNPRNYTRRKIEKLLLERNCLFNNKQLIDRNKMQQAGLG